MTQTLMPPDIWISLPYLAAWRIDRCLTQRELGERANLSKYTIIGLEVGRSRARRTTVRQLAAALNITPKQLMYEGPPRQEASAC